MKLLHITFLSLALVLATSLAFSEENKNTESEGQKFEKLQLKNGDVIKLSTEEAAEMNRQALENSTDMIDKSDEETKAALLKAAEQLHLKLPTKTAKGNRTNSDSKSEAQNSAGSN